jgi:hypothetical protein
MSRVLGICRRAGTVPPIFFGERHRRTTPSGSVRGANLLAAATLAGYRMLNDMLTEDHSPASEMQILFAC